MKLRYKVAVIILLVIFIFIFNIAGVVKSLLYYDTVRKYSQQYGIDPLFVLALIYAESGFIPHAKSKKGALGLMQILPSTFEELSKELNIKPQKELLKNPHINIHLGVYYLSKLKKEKFIETDVKLLCAYNAGITKTLSWKKKSDGRLTIKDIPYPETRSYVRKVLRVHRWLKKVINQPLQPLP